MLVNPMIKESENDPVLLEQYNTYPVRLLTQGSAFVVSLTYKNTTVVFSPSAANQNDANGLAIKIFWQCARASKVTELPNAMTNLLMQIDELTESDRNAITMADKKCRLCWHR